MIDRLYDRGYQDGRHELHSGIDRAVARVASLFTGGAQRRKPVSRRRDGTGLA